MRSAAGRIILKIVILLCCIACVITKVLTDQLSRRVFLRNQKLSREWGLLHNLYWSSWGNAFANITFGGFTLITVLMLVSRIIDAKSRPTLVEKIFLTVGMLCFFAMGGVIFSAFDQVPSDLHVNAIVLGSLSFLVALLMLIDLADPMARYISETTQTDFPVAAGGGDVPSTKEQPNQIIAPFTPNAGATTNRETHPNQTDFVDTDVQRNGDYTPGDTVDYVHAKMLPAVQQPVFEKLLLPEKQRPHRHEVVDPRSNTSRQFEYATPPFSYLPPPQVHSQNGPNPFAEPQPYHSQHHFDNDDAAIMHPTNATASSYSRQSTVNLSRGQHQRHQHPQPQQQQPQYRPAHYSPPQQQQQQPHSIPLPKYGHHHQQQRRRHDWNASPPPPPLRQLLSSSTSANRRKSHRDDRGCSGGSGGGHSSCGEEDNTAHPTPIQPGFVAHAARFWDQRAKQNTELNTIV